MDQKPIDMVYGRHWPVGCVSMSCGLSRHVATGCVDGKVHLWDSLLWVALEPLPIPTKGEYLVSISRLMELLEYLTLENSDKVMKKMSSLYFKSASILTVVIVIMIQ